jgi:hypothetical protein
MCLQDGILKTPREGEAISLSLLTFIFLALSLSFSFPPSLSFKFYQMLILLMNLIPGDIGAVFGLGDGALVIFPALSHPLSLFLSLSLPLFNSPFQKSYFLISFQATSAPFSVSASPRCEGVPSDTSTP